MQGVPAARAGHRPVAHPASRRVATVATVCGRFVSVSTAAQLQERFAVDEVRTEPLPERYNVAPSSDVYSIIERDGTRRLGTLRWGFVPHFTEQLKGARTPINARLETVHTSKMFARAFEKRRCLLPADGFYEWQKREDGTKQPYHLHARDDGPFAFGGIWTVWRDPAQGEDADPLFSTAIVTTAADGELTRIHERVPLIVPQRLWQDWLTATPDEAPHLHRAVSSLGAPALVAEPISDRVNNVRNEGPQLVVPLDAA
ncbi:SOS response-associated peptidase [Nitriliruptoraceae bacterium ZYF776]|nr:SOS response-associated peptidase [Profundirhabdus halotolerans]